MSDARDKWAGVPDDVRATVEAWSRALDAACDTLLCPRCGDHLARTTDPRQHGAYRTRGRHHERVTRYSPRGLSHPPRPRTSIIPGCSGTTARTTATGRHP